MTNKKLKPRNIQHGIMKRDIVNANGKVLLTAMCALHHMGVGAKTLVDMFLEYAEGTVKQWRQNFDDDVFDKKFAQELDRINITEQQLEPIVSKILGKLPVGSAKKHSRPSWLCSARTSTVIWATEKSGFSVCLTQ